MDVTINQVKVDLDSKDLKTFKELMDLIYRSQVGRDHVITCLIVNGNELSLEEEDAMNDVALSEVESLKITSRPASDVLRDGLKTGEAAIDQLVEDCKTCATAFKNKDIQKGGEALGEATGLIQWLLHLMHGMTVILRMPEDTQINDKTFGSHKRLFDDHIKTLHDCAEKQDFGNMADVLEKQFIPSLSIWKEIFKKALAARPA